MKKRIKIIGIIIAIIIVICLLFGFNNNELKSIKNEKELLNLYESHEYKPMPLIKRVLTLPFSLMFYDNPVVYNTWSNGWNDVKSINTVDVLEDSSLDSVTATSAAGSGKDYSKTNIQVENVDEADIIKTDGDYIYSLSGNKVIITNVKNPNNIKVESEINSGGIPNDLIIYKDKLVVLSANDDIYYKQDTLVKIYDISNRSKPKLVKSLKLYEAYYTTRCIDNKLYVFSRGTLRKENDHIVRTYKEDSNTKEIAYKNIKYLENDISSTQTLIAEVDLDKLDDVKVDSYLIDISNAYVSENGIYLTNTNYDSDKKLKVRDIFGFKGIFGAFDDYYDNSYGRKTQIYKFNINKDGVKYSSTTKLKGFIINQYSLDENGGNLRIALESDEGTRVVVLDNKLHKLGETENVAKGEIMYSSRFMGDRAYLVTYRNTDPLFVLDLSNPKNPKFMGELKIPGYSTYLHPYDENHLIGIGMETKETIDRDFLGKVINTSVSITGMKMSLFDVSDINDPKQLSKTVIGDSRTVSAVLTNPKAFLFSKKKNLLAIPVNNYSEDFTAKTSKEYEGEIRNFTDRSKNYVSEGYFVYDINLKDGFNLKGIINHDKSSSKYYYYSYYQSKLLRGLYIEDNLFTVSENEIKVNKLDNLEQVSDLKLNEKGVDNNGK